MKKMNTTIQIAEEISKNGRNIQNVFDVLYCTEGEPKKFGIKVDNCILYNGKEEKDKYNYKLVMRYIDDPDEKKRGITIMEGVLPPDEDDELNDQVGQEKKADLYLERAKTKLEYGLVKGCFIVQNSVVFLGEGCYAIEFYAKEIDDSVQKTNDGAKTTGVKMCFDTLQACAYFEVKYQ